MPEGTSVGTIYFDLALKDTINAQLQAAAARTKAQVQHAFNSVGDQIQKSISATGTQAAQAAGAEAGVEEVAQVHGDILDAVA